MQSTIINNKPLIEKNNEKRIDITTQTIRYTNEHMTILQAFYVGEDMVMRPDLISYTAYGSSDYYDVLLKYNGISNPFSLDYEDLIIVPELSELQSNFMKNSDNDNTNDIRSQYINPNKKSTIDPKKLEYDELLKSLKTNTKSYKLPPNISNVGETEAIIKDNSVHLGAYIGTQK